MSVRFPASAGMSFSKAEALPAGTYPHGRKQMSRNRLIVIGGDAAGMSAASQAKRRRPELEIIVFERSPHTSFSA